MPRSFTVSMDRNVPIPMRDGTILYADVYRPAGQGDLPVVLQRTPYNKEGDGSFALRAAGEGYAVVLQDTRGRWTSEGTFHAFRDEQEDGHDTCAWLCEQPWSNGRIGMFGASYVGLTQWQAAIGQAPGLEAIVPSVTASDYHEGWCYQGGAFELNFLLSWTQTFLASDTAERRLRDDPGFLAQRDALIAKINMMDREFERMPLAGEPLLHELAPYYDEWLDHPALDPWWQQFNVDSHYEQLDVAALNVGGWYDIFLGGTLQNFLGMRGKAKSSAARDRQKLLIGPWTHITSITQDGIGEYYPGHHAYHGFIDFHGIHLRWYDRWLRDVDNGSDREPPVTIFVMGENRWRQEEEWPLARTDYQEWFLHSGGRANSRHGDGTLSRDSAGSERPDHFLYDPLNPVPTKGGGLCCNFYWSDGGAFDQSEIENRPDVLCYTSAPFEQPLEVTGPVIVTLYAASSAIDTDFTAKLVDVCPCGCARNLTDGILRARYRSSPSTAGMLTPGDPTRFDIDLWATSIVFAAGHQIRVEISSSNFPRFDRNPNTGGVIATTTLEECVPATQTIFHDASYPSKITLPVIPAT